VQYAVKSGQVFVIEANPRASRTVPFVAKATGVPLAKAAARVTVGATLAQLRDEGILFDAPEYPGADGAMGHVAIKEAVLPFNRFPDADALLGPEMRSTGEVMGIDVGVGRAFAKAQLAAGTRLPESGTVFLSLADRDKDTGLAAAVQFITLGFELAATAGTAAHLRNNGVAVAVEVAKIGEDGTDAVELIAGGKVDLVVNSPRGRGPRADGAHIRAAAGVHQVPLLTTAAAGLAAANGMADRAEHSFEVRSLQDYHRDLRRARS
jgi:carbamoyl-phosphate synthase large subunit